MKNLIISILSLIIPIFAYADRYGIYDDPELYGSGRGVGIGGFIGSILCIGFSWWFIATSLTERKERRKSGIKVERDGIGLLIISLIGYALVATFLSAPFLFIIKWIGGVSLVKEYWQAIIFTAFCIVTYIRQT